MSDILIILEMLKNKEEKLRKILARNHNDYDRHYYSGALQIVIEITNEITLSETLKVTKS